MFDVISVGSAVVDSFIEVGDQYYKKGKISFDPGDKVLIDGTKFQIGGGAVNAAIAFSRLGFKTAVLGKIGCGHNSKRIINELKAEKISIKHIVRDPKSRTGYSIIIEAEGKDRFILAFKGANSNLKSTDVGELKTKWVYYASMVGTSLKTQVTLANKLHKQGISLAYNPSCYVIQQHKDLVCKILKKTHLLVLNMEEAYDLVGKKGLTPLLIALHQLGPKKVVVTDGGRGAYACDMKSCYHVLPKGVKRVDTTGAGDAFSSTFLYAYAKGHSVDEALRLAQLNAEAVLGKVGAHTGLLPYTELRKRLNKERRQVRVTDV